MSPAAVLPVSDIMNKTRASQVDSVFWLHHAEMDRLLSVWQDRPGDADRFPILEGATLIMDPWSETASKLLSIPNLAYS
jgi:hypothetical protein